MTRVPEETGVGLHVTGQWAELRHLSFVVTLTATQRAQQLVVYLQVSVALRSVAAGRGAVAGPEPETWELGGTAVATRVRGQAGCREGS